MKQSKWFFHPILIFIYSILALTVSLFLYIYWYVKISSGTRELARRFDLSPEQFFAPQTWIIILALSVLFGIILMGIIIIFVYHQKTFQLFRLQNNFINNFTHELKTPVASLQLYLETFKKHSLPRKEQLKYIDFMIKDVSRLSENINSILNTARIESKNITEDFVRINLLEFMEEFWNKERYHFENCRISITNNSDEPFYSWINISLFEMLLMNLLTNAFKYNDSPAPEVDIIFTRENKKFFIDFIDNGIGLKNVNISEIFKKFYKVRKTNSKYPKGSGLGLYLAQQIARVHKWKISAKNREDKNGAIFTLTLPYNDIL